MREAVLGARTPFRLLCIFIGSISAVQAQDDNEEESQRKAHRVTIMMANAHIPQAIPATGEKTVFLVPTWGVDYDYWFSPRWAIGLHNDIMLQDFTIEEYGDGRSIDRYFPISVSVVALYKPFDKWIFTGGLGREFEKNESLYLFTAGVEYGIEMRNDWELNFNLIFENKWEAYDNWLFGVGFSKLF